MNDAPLAFLDIETTGLDPLRHEVLEVAYLRNVGSNFTAADVATTHFSKPINLDEADEQALRINKYHDREPELKQIEIPWRLAAAKIAVELDGHMIVGANPTFDITFLRILLADAELEPTWHYRCIDLNTLAAGWIGDPTPISTQAIAEEFKVPLGKEQHTALADARWNREAYYAICSTDPCES